MQWSVPDNLLQVDCIVPIHVWLTLVLRRTQSRDQVKPYTRSSHQFSPGYSLVTAAWTCTRGPAAMEEREAVRLISQYLYEHVFRTSLQALQRESGRAAEGTGRGLKEESDDRLARHLLHVCDNRTAASMVF